MIPQLDLFRKRHVQACITGRIVEKLKPISALVEYPESLEFYSPGRPLHYAALDKMVLRVVVRMRKKASKANLLENDVNNSVVDCTLHSFFSSCEVLLSETPVTKYPQHYGYASVFDIYSTAGYDSLDGPLQTVPVIPDENKVKPEEGAFWKQREAPYLQSKKVELMGLVRADICKLKDGAYILDNVPIRVRFTLQPQEFVLWSAAAQPDVELVIDEVDLSIPYYLGNAELGLGLDMALSQQPANYHFKSTQVRTYIHAGSSTNIDIPIAINGKLPSSILFTMVKTSDFNGNIKTNPFNFIHAGLQELSIFVNGVETKFRMNMEVKQGCSTLVHSLYQDQELSAGGVWNVEKMHTGYFACAVDLTIDQSGRLPSQNLDQYGTVRLSGRLKEAVNYSLCILLYAQYDTSMEINASREVTIF
jgi:hypothetical protein